MQWRPYQTLEVYQLPSRSFTDIIGGIRGIAQLVARLVWDQEVAGSSPATPTTSEIPSIPPQL
jgi:hypothetical protein